jgi:hypothetical protein
LFQDTHNLFDTMSVAADHHVDMLRHDGACEYAIAALCHGGSE